MSLSRTNRKSSNETSLEGANDTNMDDPNDKAAERAESGKSSGYGRVDKPTVDHKTNKIRNFTPSTSEGNDNDRSAISMPLQLQNRGSKSDIQTNEMVGDSSAMETNASTAQEPYDESTEQNNPQTDQQDEQSSINTQDKMKKDRSKLRKGKWTVEEEEYTSRIIQHFSTGLLTLPDGATLRSYLAEKLNCDPMRITKKFTGACCLGRRVYHLREKPRGSPAEIEMAKAELHHLEQRFRMRVEHEQSGLPLSRQQELLLAQPPTAPSPLFPLQGFAAGTTNPIWNPHFNTSGLPINSALAALQGNSSIQGLGRPAQSTLGNLGSGVAGPWLVPTTSEINAPPAPPLASLQDQSLLLLNNLVNSWAWSQATASLRPNLSALGVPSSSPQAPIHTKPQVQGEQRMRQTNEDLQRQLRETFEEHKREELRRAGNREAENLDLKPPANTLNKGKDSSTKTGISPAEQLQRSYEEHLKKLSLQQHINSSANGDDNVMSAPHATKSKESPLPSDVDNVSEEAKPLAENDEKSNTTNDKIIDEDCLSEAGRQASPERKSDLHTADEEAGTILLGFLNSLRQSYEDAVDVRGNKAETEDNQATKAPAESEAQEPLPPQETAEPQEPNLSQGSTRDTIKKLPKGKRALKKRNLGDISSGSIQNGSIAVSQQATHFRNTPAPPRSGRPASVTDTSTLSRSETSSGASNPTESSSSLEDSDSKSDKTDGSSSEESEKDCQINMTSRGPPRKRLKARKFTKRNLMEHSNRLQQAPDKSMDGGGF